MVNYKRQLNLPNLLKKKYFFLLGPRAIGKSYLIQQQLAPQAIILDLLRSELYFRLSAAPWELEKLIDAQLSPQKKLLSLMKFRKSLDC